MQIDEETQEYEVKKILDSKLLREKYHFLMN